ncbi:hypothetical protein CDO52_26610 [Nocardiopsis gilva YIM 90087]|uniref:Uncharacterized protein n=1 Tax=Nocardiopsis gilva YIM 90087 TaxID=1235441 RepID=A0A223SCM3_9ACTN|nr:hypothetical protein CDO52_26610 [Nocardiopsis gilva YIM 90087]
MGFQRTRTTALAGLGAIALADGADVAADAVVGGGMGLHGVFHLELHDDAVAAALQSGVGVDAAVRHPLLEQGVGGQARGHQAGAVAGTHLSSYPFAPCARRRHASASSRRLARSSSAPFERLVWFAERVSTCTREL